MSFEKWYEEEKKKKKKETSDFENWYNSTKETTTTSKREDDNDIAPVVLHSRPKELGGSFVKDEEDKPSWFQGGAFSDGYQFGDVSKTIIGTVADVSDNINTAVVDATENLIDTGAHIVGVVGGWFNKDFREDVGDFIAKEILAPTQTGEAITKYTNPIGLANELINGGKTEENSLLGDKSDGLVQSAAHLVGSYALQMVGVPAWLTQGVNAFGSEIESALQQDATFMEATNSGVVSAAAEIIFEKISSGIKFKGGALDEGLEKALTNGIKNKLGRTVVKYVTDAGLEGTEEVLTEATSAVGRKLTYASDKEWNEILSSEDVFDAFVGGAVMSGALGGGKIVKSAKDGTDFTSGMTDNEEKVVKKLYEDALAEKQKDGTKLSYGEKNKLWDSIIDDMSKGQLNIDDIESVLGGDTYKAYQDVVKSEDAILKEFEELGKKQNPTLAEMTRYNELKAKVDEINAKSNRTQLKNQLSEEVFNLVQGDTTGRLAESYNEVARKGVAFEADLTKYKGKQKEAVQRAIDSGVLNNTYRSHELVNILSKIEADKGITFDYTNNAKLKKSGFAVEGKTVNGFADKSTGAVTLNVQSAKSWQSVVGHEVTHVLEGTDAYDTLQKALYAYAESKGELASRKANLTELYKNMDTDIDAELTADLVGDYLFTDKGFITHLTTNRNLFQKVYDEIKYLWNVATGKEKAEIEKVKREFDKAWKELNVNKAVTEGTDNVKMSVSPETLDSIKEKYKDKTDHLYIFERKNGTISIDNMVVKSEFRNQGVGTEILNDILAYADANGKTVTLTPTSEFGTKAKLTKWYKANGFVENKGRNADYTLSDTMYRLPKENVKYSVSTDSNGNELSIAVQKRFANSKAVDEDGNLKVLYHGTYGGEFYTFDKAKGSVEGDFGSGFYFTDNEYDVERNYEGGGPDFENKVARRAEQIESEEEIDYSEAEARAREELFVGSNKHEVYLNIENPAVVGETTLLDYESFAQEYDIDDYDSEEDYEGDVEQLIADTIDNVIWEVEKNVDVYSTDGLSEILWEAVNEGGIDIEQLKANINNLYLEDSEGNLVGNEVTRQIIESLGYDGIIDNTVSSKFRNMGLDEGTTHYIVFKPNQIKSITNQNPTDNPDIRYSISEETDVQYQKAVERGDTKTAQLMVDEAAKNAGYDIKAYHGTGYDFTVFDKSKQGDNYQDWGRLGKGFYFAPNARQAQTWAERSRGAKNNVMSVYLRSENMLDSFEALPDDLKDTIPAEWDSLTRRLAEKYVYNYVDFMQEFGYDVQKIFIEKGYDGINGDVEFVVYDPEQVKSADAITYDDKGNIISLSERFNTAHEDIRFSLSEETNTEYMSAIAKGDMETAQRMVDDAAEKWSNGKRLYTTDAETGEIVFEFYRSSDGGRTVWNGHGNNPNQGVFLTSDKHIADAFDSALGGVRGQTGGKHITVYAKAENPFVIDAKGQIYTAIPVDEGSIPDWVYEKSSSSVEWSDEANDYVVVDSIDIDNLYPEAFKRGYDAVIVKNVKEGVGGGVATDVVLKDGGTQMKSADPVTYDDNGKVIPLNERFNPDKVDIRNSLSQKGDRGSRTGDYNTPLNDLYYEGVAPVNVATDTNVGGKTQTVAPVVEDYSTTPDSLEAQIYQAEETVLSIINEAKELEQGYAENRYTDEEYNNKYSDIMSRYSDAIEKHDSLLKEVTKTDNERFASLSDEDAPPELEAPYYGDAESITPGDVFAERDIKAVGNRKVKAYMYENPEVKPFFQGEAGAMLSELQNSIKGERFRLDDGSWTGTQRYTSPEIAELLDVWKYSYDQIEAGLRAIIEGNGKENNAVSKRIEFLLDSRLRNGYTDIVYGDSIPADQEYIDLMANKSLEDYYSDSFNNLVQNADKYMPLEDDIAPVNDAFTANTEQKPVINFDGEQGMFNGFEAEQEAPVKPQQQTAKILTEEPVVAKKKGRTLSKAVANFVDKGAVFENLSLKTKNRALQAKYNFMHYSNSKAQHFIANGAEGVKPLKTIFETVEKSGKTQQFYEYLYHYHNIDRMSLETAENQSKRMELRKQFQGYSDEAIKTIASEWITKDTPKNVEYRIRKAREYVEASKTKNKPVFGYDVTADMSRDVVERLEKANPEFKQWAQDVYSNNAYLRKLLVYNGVISPETADLWAKMYSHYVPIRRAGDTGLSVNVPLDTNRTGINAPVKKATGGNSDILPLFNTIAQRAEQTYKAIAKNNFGVELMNTLNSSVSVDKTATSLDDVIDSIDNHDGLLQEGKNGKNPTFTVFEGGERVTFEITEEMYDALKPTSEELSKTYKIPNAISNFRKATLTEYNPWFLLKNAIKDTQDVLINSQHAAKTYLNIPSAIKEMAANGKWYNEYIANGGEQNTYFDDETNTFKSENNAIEFAKKITGLNAISKANNVVEMLPRLAEYIASRKSGRSIEVSMLDAARVTTNFAAGGDITKFANRNGATFLNASVQGAMQQVRNIREAKMNGLRGWANLAAKYAIAGLPALLLNHLLWDDDEEYEELSDYVKQNYYIVGKYGDGKFVRIPKGRTVAVIQNAFEQMENAVTGDDEVDLKSFLDLVVSNLAPNNPLDNNIISPIIDVAKNETWYGEDLVPTRLQDVPESEQYDESTDELSKWLGEKLNYSPIKINYMLDQYSGVVGDTFLPMMTPEAESGDDSVGGKMIAPLKDMLTTDSVMKNQNISDFYDTQEKLTIAANGSSATDEDVLKSKYMSAKNAELSELYKQKREIQNSELSDKEKYNAVREVQKQIVDIARNSLSTYENVNVDGSYATVGDLHYHLDKNGAWVKVTDKQLEKQQDVTRSLGISGAEYWGNKEEYDYAYESPEKHAISKTVGGYDVYKTYSSELYDIKADKDENGKSINGSRKEKVVDYINNLDADYGAKIILFKSEYPSDDTYNEDIVNYVNNLESLSYEERIAIFTELGFVVSGDTVYWD